MSHHLIEVPADEDFVPLILNGEFLGILIGLERGNQQPTGIPFRPLFQLVVTPGEKGHDDSGNEHPADEMNDKIVKGPSLWINPKPEKGQEWKNKFYRDEMEKLGYVWDVNPDTGNKLIRELADEDVYGYTFKVKIGPVENEKKKRTYHEVVSYELQKEFDRLDYKEYVISKLEAEAGDEEAE